MTPEAIRAYKATRETLNAAFDRESVDRLILLGSAPPDSVKTDGTEFLEFARLLAGGLAESTQTAQNGPLVLCKTNITDKGRRLLEAWRAGDREAFLGAAREAGAIPPPV